MKRGQKRHRWAYSNGTDAWFCERCKVNDYSGNDVSDDDPCPGERSVKDAAKAARTPG